MLHYATLRYSTLLYAMLLYTTLRYSTLWYSKLLYTTLCYSTQGTLRYTRQFYATLNYTTLLYATLFYATLHHDTQLFSALLPARMIRHVVVVVLFLRWKQNLLCLRNPEMELHRWKCWMYVMRHVSHWVFIPKSPGFSCFFQMPTGSHILITDPMKFNLCLAQQFLNVKTTSTSLSSLVLVGFSPRLNLVVDFLSVSCHQPNLPNHSKVSIIQATSLLVLFLLFGFFLKGSRSKQTAFRKPYAAPFFTACPKSDLPLPLPTLISFFRMGNWGSGSFFCMVHFFFVNTVHELAVVTSIAFHFGVVPLISFLNMFSSRPSAIPPSSSSGVGTVAVRARTRGVLLVILACCRATALTILTAVTLRILGSEDLSKSNMVQLPIIPLCSIEHSLGSFRWSNFIKRSNSLAGTIMTSSVIMFTQ